MRLTPEFLVDRLRALDPADRWVLAVSGGGDSMALLQLCAGLPVSVVTVDHGLRPDSGMEARAVAAESARLGLPHETLVWEGPKPTSNLQAAARDARYRLLLAAARRKNAALVLAHTQDDQAETVLMRLARGSGVDGLAAMHPVSSRDGVVILRPLLEVSRAALRDWLRANEFNWIEDPSNEDLRFDRIRIRKALADLSPLGLTPERLARTARMMSLAQEVLEDAAKGITPERTPFGEVRLPLEVIRAARRETGLRVFATALKQVGGFSYRPRLNALESAFDALTADSGVSRCLHGCLSVRRGGVLSIMREPGRCTARITLENTPVEWDGRFRVDGPPGLVVAPLGETGLSDVECADPNWNAAPRAVRLTTPGFWRDGRLVAAPLAEWSHPEAKDARAVLLR